MRLALGDDLPSSCIDTMLSIATQVTISFISFYAILCYVCYATQFYSILINSILFFLLSSVCALCIFIYYHVRFEAFWRRTDILHRCTYRDYTPWSIAFLLRSLSPSLFSYFSSSLPPSSSITLPLPLSLTLFLSSSFPLSQSISLPPSFSVHLTSSPIFPTIW